MIRDDTRTTERPHPTRPGEPKPADRRPYRFETAARRIAQALPPNWRSRRRGLWIAFLGPDGSGKSTVIGEIEAALAPAFVRTKTLHFRPRVGLPPGSTRPVVDPHAAPPRGPVASTLKLLYLLCDYGIGYWLGIRPMLSRSTLVLFDRYYHDLLVDPLRYRHGGPLWPARAVARMVPQPDLWVLLDAPPGVLQARKQEVPIDEVHRQRRAYRALAGTLPNSFVIDAARSLDAVVDDVVRCILTRLSAPVRSR